MEDLLLRLRYFYEDHQKVVISVGIVLMLGFLILLTVTIEKKQENTSTDISLVDELNKFDSDVAFVKKHFSLIQEINTGISPKRPAMELTLYLKTPYMDKEEFTKALNSLVNIYKVQYNVDKKQYLTGMKFHIYTRYADFTEGLDPLFTGNYMLKELSKSKVKETEEREKNGEIVNLQEIFWEESIRQDKLPDYTKYKLVNNFNPYNIDVIGLSDEEYDFYLKIRKYERLTGSMTQAIKLYIEWEYGVPLNSVGYGIKGQFSDFYERETSNLPNDNNPFLTRYFEYDKVIATENPSLYLYNLTRYVAKDNIEAMQILVRQNPDKFRQLFTDYLMNNIEDVDELDRVDAEFDELVDYLNEIIENGTDTGELTVPSEGEIILDSDMLPVE